MLKITIKEIQYIAELAKLKFTQDEATDIVKGIHGILSDFDNITWEDDITNDMNGRESAISVFRKDEVQSFKEKEELFQNTKCKREGYLELPKIVE